jgi:nucleoside-diphosphate-sugar epimerase
MQSIVLGGSGIVGGHIVSKLVTAGERPFAISRSQRADKRAVQWIQGDLTHPEALQLPRITTVYCTAHSLLLAKALPSLFSDELQRVVLFTSTSIVTKLNSDIPAEREGLQRLAEGEQQTIDMCTRMGVGWTVLRPTMIYDEGRDANVSRLARLIQKVGVMPLAGRGSGLRQPVHAEDLAIGALNAASSTAARDKIYALPGPDAISYREMVGRIFDGLGKRRRIVTVPPVLWRAAFALAAPLLPNANAAMGERMAKDMVFDAAPAVRDFGWRPRSFQPKFENLFDELI